MLTTPTATRQRSQRLPKRKQHAFRPSGSTLDIQRQARQSQRCNVLHHHRDEQRLRRNSGQERFPSRRSLEIRTQARHRLLSAQADPTASRTSLCSYLGYQRHTTCRMLGTRYQQVPRQLSGQRLEPGQRDSTTGIADPRFRTLQRCHAFIIALPLVQSGIPVPWTPSFAV